MAELIFVFIFIVWYVLSLIVSERYGKNSKLNVEWLFFIAMIISPLLTFVVVKLWSKFETNS